MKRFMDYTSFNIEEYFSLMVFFRYSLINRKLKKHIIEFRSTSSTIMRIMGLEVRNCTLHRVCLSLLDRYSQVSPASDTLVPFISWHISSSVSVTLENNSCVDSLKNASPIYLIAATFIAMKHFSKMKKNTQSCMKDYIFAAGKSRNTLSLRC